MNGGTLIARAGRRTLGQIRHVTPVPPGSAEGLVARVYGQAERDFGMLAPPVALHSPAPPVLAAAWLMLSQCLLAAGSVGRDEKEAAAAATSAGNACPYCASVHAAVAARLLPGHRAATIAAGDPDAAGDDRLRSIARWARHGPRPDPPPPPRAEHFAELAGVAVTFQYLNRMVNVFLPDSPLPAAVPGRARGMLMRVLGAVMLAPPPAPGDAAELLPAAPLPDEFAWAAGEPRVADALARAAAAIQDAGVQAVPPAVRELVTSRLDRWDGWDPGLSRAWADDAIAVLKPADRAAGRLALLTAFSSYQVTAADIEDFRPRGGDRGGDGDGRGDDRLIALTAWASMAAARGVGARMGRQRLGPAANA
jgi:AhpD family alkylhydroperoxidase